MTVVSAFLVPGTPLPLLNPDARPWQALAQAMRHAGRSLAASQPDAVLLYSTQWFAVLDQQWLTRRQSASLHVDENWYAWGDMPYDLHADSELALACVAASPRVGVHARGVNYDGFPIDSGTIAASTLLGIGTPELPLVVGSNNLYHDASATARLARMAVASAKEQDKRVAVVGVGGLSGSLHRHLIEPDDDALATPQDDAHNGRLLRCLESGDAAALHTLLPGFVSEARADMGMKHLHWVLGALDNRLQGATVHAYGPVWGSGAAVVEFRI